MAIASATIFLVFLGAIGALLWLAIRAVCAPAINGDIPALSRLGFLPEEILTPTQVAERFHCPSWKFDAAGRARKTAVNNYRGHEYEIAWLDEAGEISASAWNSLKPAAG